MTNKSMVLSTGMEKSRNTVGFTLGDEAAYLRLALFLIVANLQDNIDWNCEDGREVGRRKRLVLIQVVQRTESAKTI